METKRTLFFCVAFLSASACGVGQGTGSDARDNRSLVPPETARQVATHESHWASDTVLARAVAAAQQDLAAELGTDAISIETAEARRVTWPDSSLGCPRQGIQYLQVLTEGFLVVLVHDGKRYRYHGAIGKPPFYCAKPGKPTDTPSPAPER